MFEEVSTKFGREVLDSPWSCMARFRRIQRRSFPHTEDPWGKNLRVFLAGGGSRSPFYRGLLADGPLEHKLMPWTAWHTDEQTRRSRREGIRVERIPQPDPERLRGFPRELSGHFDRLSVAYGLSLGRQNLMKVVNATRD